MRGQMKKRKLTGDDRGGMSGDILLPIADIVLPLLIYYLVSSIMLVLLNEGTKRVFADAAGGPALWMREHPDAVRVINNAVAMIVGAFCVRRKLLQEALTEGGPLAIKPREAYWGWCREGVSGFARKWKQYVLPVLIAAGAALSCNYLISYMQVALRDKAYQEVAAAQYAVPLWLGLILYGIVSPIAEESIFRGILYNQCRRYTGKPFAAAFISASMFGALHGNVMQAAYGFAMGLLIAFFYEKYRSFLVPVLMHAAMNVSVFVCAYFYFF